MTRRGGEAMLAILFAAVLVVAGGGVVYVLITAPVHSDVASVPTTRGLRDNGYSGAIEESRRLALSLVVKENLPGLSIAIANDRGIVWTEAFGFANVERREPVTPATRFQLGSVSKTLTAAAVLLLHDRGRVDLDAPIQTYVPAYPKKQWTVTPRQLMGDIAGVHVIRGDNNDQVPRDCSTLDAALKFFADEPLLFQPGTSYRFGTNGWILLSALIESVAAEPFPAFMTHDVFTPLGMDSTVLDIVEDAPGASTFYRPRAAETPKLGVEITGSRRYHACLFGGGGYLSTPSDLARFGSAMLKPGLLKADTIILLQTPLRLASGASTNFALGWKAEQVQLAGASARMLAHRATPTGGTAAILLFPDQQLAIALGANVSNADAIGPFGITLAETFATSSSRHP
jgi:CubicO group peptidase (beta-lactamase class C family)